MNIKKNFFISSLALIYLSLVGCAGDEIELVGDQYYVCNYSIMGGGGLMLPFPDIDYGNAPKNEPCLSKYTAAVQHNWANHSAYQADMARFDITALQGVRSRDETLEGSWLVIYDFEGQGSEDNGRWNRQVCNVTKKQNEAHIYQADCPQLQGYGDLAYNPNTASLSNDGIGQLPNDNYPLGQKVALNDLVVQDFSKINGVAKFTRNRASGDPAISDRAFQMVRLGDTNQVFGTLRLRDVAALTVDSSAPYTTTWEITAFKESIQFSDNMQLDTVNGLDKKDIKMLRYEFSITDGQAQKNILITHAQMQDWVKADTQKRDYYCFDNGSDNGCENTNQYPMIDQFIKYDSLLDYVRYSNRTMVLGQANKTADAADLTKQALGYFDILQADKNALKIHFRYENGEVQQDGLLELTY